jgi:hypothetical protein
VFEEVEKEEEDESRRTEEGRIIQEQEEESSFWIEEGIIVEQEEESSRGRILEEGRRDSEGENDGLQKTRNVVTEEKKEEESSRGRILGEETRSGGRHSAPQEVKNKQETARKSNVNEVAEEDGGGGMVGGVARDER